MASISSLPLSALRAAHAMRAVALDADHDAHPQGQQPGLRKGPSKGRGDGTEVAPPVKPSGAVSQAARATATLGNLLDTRA